MPKRLMTLKRLARVKGFMSLTELAEDTDGVSQGYLYQISGGYMPPEATRRRISRALNCSDSELVEAINNGGKV